MKRWTAWPPAIGIAWVLLFALYFPSAQPADERIQYTEQMVGAGHPTKTDTLNRLILVEHNTDGTHKYLPGLDVRKYGAKLDGSTNDSTAFGAAHDALPAGSTQNGGALNIPSGIAIIKNWTITTSGANIGGAGSGYVSKQGATILQPPNGVSNSNDDVIRVSGTGTVNVVLRDFEIYGIAPNGTDRASRCIASTGTRLRVENVYITGCDDWAFDNSISGADADSSDGGGVFRSQIYGKGVRISSANFTFSESYLNGNNSTTAIRIQGNSPTFGAPNIVLDKLVVETYQTPILDIGSSSGGATLDVTLRDSSIGSSGGTGTIIQVGDRNGSGGFLCDRSRISGANTEARAITVANLSGWVRIVNCSIIGTYSGGTGAPILLPLGIYGDIEILGSGQIEWNGYKSWRFSFLFWGIDGSGYSRGAYHLGGIEAQTTNATPTAIWKFPLPNPSSAVLKAKVIGEKSDGSAMYGFEVIAGGRNSGTATILGATQQGATAMNEGSGSGAAATWVAGTAETQLRVTGIASTTINWRADVEVLRR